MAVYKPKAIRKGIRLPFGYFVNPLDPCVAVPDPKKIDALNYAFRMKAKYGTSLRDCTQWLHVATGDRMTPHGFLYAYNNWKKKLKKERAVQIQARKKELLKVQQKYIDDNMKHLEIVLDDGHDITALAEAAAKEEWKKKQG